MVEDPKKDPDEGLSDSAKAMHEAQPYLSVAWRLVGGCVVGIFGGWVVDRFAGTGPWGLIIGSFIGICVGFYAMIKTLGDLEKKRKAAKK